MKMARDETGISSDPQQRRQQGRKAFGGNIAHSAFITHW